MSRRIAVRLGRHGWERFDNFTEEWHLLPFLVSDCLDNARRYVAERYGVRVRDVEVAR